MRKGLQFRVLALIGILISATSQATLIEIVADRDNTLYEHPTLDLSNGLGPDIFAGVTGSNNSTNRRRALLHFDVNSVIPAASMITSVTLRINVSNFPGGAPPSPFTFHRVEQDWGEGTSIAGGPGGSGAGATPGGATWDHTFFSSQFWNNPGGDYVATPSVTNVFGGLGQSLVSGSGLIADVQSWVDGSVDNYGWIILGDEFGSRNARRFTSTNGDPDFAPTLVVGFAAIPEASSTAMILMGLVLVLVRVRNVKRQQPSRAGVRA